MRPTRLFAGLGLAALAAAAAAGFSTLGYAPASATAASAQYAPQNTAPPFISDLTPVEGQRLTANVGAWSNSPTGHDIAWQRCDAEMKTCNTIPNAGGSTYTVSSADKGFRLRLSVTGKNASGSTTAYSGPTDPVGGAQPSDQVRLSNGVVSIPASQVVNTSPRLVVSDVQFSPNPVRSRLSPITVRVRVTDTRGYAVRNAIVFVRSTPLVTTESPERPTGMDGWVTFVTYPRRDFVLKPGHAIQFFVRARKAGDDVLTGVSTRRLVQVGMAR